MKSTYQRLHWYLYYFLAGLITIAYEILAVRVIQPFFGNSIYTWSHVISIVLVGLSLGQLFHSKSCDNLSHHNLIKRLIILSLVTVLFMSSLSFWSFSALSFIREMDIDFRISSLLASILVCLAPATLLGAISPVVYRLILGQNQNVAQLSARLGASNTVGSWIGAIAVNFIFFDYLGLGINQCLLLLSSLFVILTTAIAYVYLSRILATSIAASALLALIFVWNRSVVHLPQNYKAVYIRETPYHSLSIYEVENKRGPHNLHVRLLMPNYNGSHASVDLNTPTLEAMPNSYSSAFTKFAPNQWATKQVLILGIGSAVGPRDIIRSLSDNEIHFDLVDIDRHQFDLAKLYFQFPNYLNISTHYEDARVFVNKTNKLYDYIVFDVAGENGVVPDHLVSLQFFLELKKLTHINTVFWMNSISIPNNSRVFFAISNTIERAFNDHQLHILPTKKSNLDKKQNVLFVIGPDSHFHSSALNFLAQNSITPLRQIPPLILTDENNIFSNMVADLF